MADRSLFEDVADALRGLTPAELGEFRCSYHRYGVKVWFGAPTGSREHYEAQVIGKKYAPGAKVVAIEVGFHSEHSKEADNDAVVARLTRHEKQWRRRLGPDPVADRFLGSATHWRRVSETWPDPDLSDPELVFEVAERLSEYFAALEPIRTAG